MGSRLSTAACHRDENDRSTAISSSTSGSSSCSDCSSEAVDHDQRSIEKEQELMEAIREAAQKKTTTLRHVLTLQQLMESMKAEAEDAGQKADILVKEYKMQYGREPVEETHA